MSHIEEVEKEFCNKFDSRFLEIARLADKNDDIGYGKGLARLQIDITKDIVQSEQRHKKEEIKWNKNKEVLRRELKKRVKQYQNISRKWDILGFLWEKKVQQLEKDLGEL